MKMHRLGSKGPEISVVGYGAWEIGGDTWGPNPGLDAIIDAMRAGFDAGITWIDTAEVYGSGNSEEITGRALEGRDEVLVFTKVAPQGAGTGFRRDEVRAACEASLKRLGRDVIDLYQLHWPTDDVPLEETWGAMASLVDDGLVRHIGVSNFDQERIERCEAIRHVDSLQPELSMLQRKPIDTGLLDACARNGTGVIGYGSLCYGLLSGKVTKDTTFGDWRDGNTGMGYYRRYFAPGKIEGNLDKVERMKPIAGRVGCTMSQLAIAWSFHQTGVTGAIVGSRKKDHVLENAGAGDVSLSDNDLVELTSILEG